jgi:hypothetical protein
MHFQTPPEEAEHHIVFGFHAQVVGRLPSGEYSGSPAHEVKDIITISCADRHIAIRKLNELVQELKNRDR